MNKKKIFNVEAAAKQFRFDGDISWIKPFGNGHIHDTFQVEALQKNRKEYFILQRINRTIFPDPPGIMENILRVTRHIRRKLVEQHFTGEEISRRVLNVILTADGSSFYIDPEDAYWRGYHFIRGAKSYDVLHTTDQLYQAAFTFGRFLDNLHDFPDPPLHETIRDFHNGPKRFKDFMDALNTDAFNRANDVKPDIDFLLSQSPIFDVIPGLIREGKIPVRVTHNDTKINNIMMDEKTGEGLCVIDLDTVMPGTSLYDFGDLARTTLSLMEEDERDLSKINVEIPRYEAILKGFMDGVEGRLTKTETDYLGFSAKLMPLLIGMRFLTDYLSGDNYFKISRPGHNLDRARRQFALTKSITATLFV